MLNTANKTARDNNSNNGNRIALEAAQEQQPRHSNNIGDSSNN